MHTYYIGKEEVLGYSRDLLSRLNRTFPKEFPNIIWCPIGVSGEVLLSTFNGILPEKITSKQNIIPLLQTSSISKPITLKSPSDSKFIKKNKNKMFLILDSSVHSGGSMLKAVRFLTSLRAKKITTYSLTVKKEAIYIPNFFGVIISEHDRPLFLLPEIPNNRLIPRGIIRKISKEDVKRSHPHLNCGVESINGMTWSDLFYASSAKGDHVYVYELNDKILAFIQLKIISHQGVFIDNIAADTTLQGQGLGGQLMRFAETLARANYCSFLNLWAIDKAIKFYQDYGFRILDNQILELKSERYTYMQKKIIYSSNFSLMEDRIPSSKIHYRNN